MNLISTKVRPKKNRREVDKLMSSVQKERKSTRSSEFMSDDRTSCLSNRKSAKRFHENLNTWCEVCYFAELYVVALLNRFVSFTMNETENIASMYAANRLRNRDIWRPRLQTLQFVKHFYYFYFVFQPRHHKCAACLRGIQNASDN